MLSLFQELPSSGKPSDNIEKMRRAATAASTIGGSLIVFPELFLCGYNISKSELLGLAEDLDGPAVREIVAVARAYSIGIVFGMAERSGASIFNTAVAISSKGEMVGAHRKIHLFGSEADIFARGSDFLVIQLDGRQVGLAICYDIEFPEVARELVRHGAEVICVPTANMMPHLEVPFTLVRARALENGVYVVYSNLCGTERGMTYTGLSCIVGPTGKDLARAGSSGTALLVSAMGEAFDQPLSTQLADLQLTKR